MCQQASARQTMGHWSNKNHREKERHWRKRHLKFLTNCQQKDRYYMTKYLNIKKLEQNKEISIFMIYIIRGCTCAISSLIKNIDSYPTTREMSNQIKITRIPPWKENEPRGRFLFSGDPFVDPSFSLLADDCDWIPPAMMEPNLIN